MARKEHKSIVEVTPVSPLDTECANIIKALAVRAMHRNRAALNEIFRRTVIGIPTIITIGHYRA